MKITFSRKKWSAIFSEIDKNYDNEIAFEELFIFLFPNHDRALAVVRIRLLAQLLACYSQYSTQERKRLQKLRKNVRERLIMHRERQKRGSDSNAAGGRFSSLSFKSPSTKGTPFY